MGVLDVGSNTVHLLLVDAHYGAAPIPASKHKAPLRLAEHTDADGVIDQELIDALVDRNDLTAERIVSVTFSVTGDLNACFPAAVARSRRGWDRVALLDCQQMAVAGDLERCIRVLALVWMPEGQLPVHPYLEGARMLRPDRSGHN